MKGRILTDKQIAAFVVYLKNEEKSENTIDKYIRDVRAFDTYVGNAEITIICFLKAMPHGVSIQCWHLSIVYSRFLGGQI